MSCPICGKDSAKDFRPFCSDRCANVDLGRWLNGSYAIPTAEVPDEAEIAGRHDDPQTHRMN